MACWRSCCTAMLVVEHVTRAIGEFVPLDQQYPALWSHPMIDEAEVHLRSAAEFKHMGRYQLEAAIQSVHANRARTGRDRLAGNRLA